MMGGPRWVDSRPIAADMKRTDGVLEYDALVIPLAVSLGFDAVIADGFAFIALDPTLAACLRRYS